MTRGQTTISRGLLAAAAFLLGNGGLTPAVAATDRVVLPDDVVPSRYVVSIVPDAERLAFTGAVEITVDVRKATRTIVLNAADLAFSHASILGIAGEAKVTLDEAQQTATLEFADKVSKGSHLVRIDYAGKINQHAAGLFALDYDANKGEAKKGRKRVLVTQFENSDARRFVPCWDEPNRKAVFELSVTVPKDDMAVSNQPEAASEPLPNGLKRVRFAPSPKMSTYLLFLGVGDLERVSRKVNGVDIGIVVKRGDRDKAGYALDTAAQLLPYYEDYFGQKYPLPKLDLVAGPGESQFFGAMENWGAILYFERYLLIDPAISTEENRRSVYLVVAHEMAHQWFGDLVTMDWWDDLWLNEGFASWMEYKAADHFHPEWKVWLTSQDSKESAMRTDARRGTHPIIQPIRDVLQANQAFDVITYSKGQAVIRMLEDYLGEEAFRAGVRNYMGKHAYGNTVTDDLWAELDKLSATPVSAIAHDFTQQAGVPLIKVTVAADGVRLTQDVFAADDSANSTATWQVPAVASVPGAGPWHDIVSRKKPQVITGARSALVNRRQAGYFRTWYDAAALKPVVDAFPNLEPEDQLGLLSDSRELGYAGYAPLADFMVLAGQASPEMDPRVLDTLAQRLAGIDDLYHDLPGQAAYRAWARRLLNPILGKLGWTARLGETQNTTLLRATVLDTLSQFADPAVIAEAKKRFAAYLKKRSSLKGDLRQSVLEIVAANADAATWDRLHELAKTAPSAVEKQELYGWLGTARDRALAERALQLALTGEPPATSRPTIVRRAAAYWPELAFDFVNANFDAINGMLEPDSRTQFVPYLVMGSYNPDLVDKLKTFAKAHIPSSARQAEVKAEAAIAFNAAVRAKRLPAVDSWLAARPAPTVSQEQQQALRLELEAMFDSDQRYRADIQKSVMADPSPKNQEAQQKRFFEKQQPLDQKNLRRLEEIIAKVGWPGRSLVGYKASNAAFLVIQHADPAAQERYFPLLKGAADKGEAQADQMAMLEDRILMHQGRKQIYGTQFQADEEHGGFKLYPIEDEKNVDQRRAKVGLPPLADYLKDFALVYKPPK